MNFKNLFGRQANKNQTNQLDNQCNDKISTPNANPLYRPIVSGPNIIYASPVPRYIDIGNLIFEKKYKEAITLGNTLLVDCNNTEYEGMIHVNLMQAYFKIRSENPAYFDLSTYHAKRAMICGHNTGFVQQRLAINLEKEGKFLNVIELCDIVLSVQFSFSRHGSGAKEEYNNRKNRMIKKLNYNESDLISNTIFSDFEKSEIFNNSKR